ANGVEYEVDCIVYATGFEVGTAYTRRSGCELHGRGGVTLSEHWSRGVRTLHGMHVHGFPNCFIMGNQQAGFTVNYPHLLNEQSRHIAYVVGAARGLGARTVEVTAEAEAQWVDTVIRLSGLGREFLESCTPGYYNNEGKPGERSGQDGFFGGGPVVFFQLLRDWRAAGSLAGLAVEAG
ncbi:MAG TPA: monooxygenase, partial [Myxococcota bacterium]|nr:monooxygenase [Myxococcota bacterium]